MDEKTQHDTTRKERAVEYLLTALDSAPIGERELFVSIAAKERYETFLSFALRKSGAARYHLRQVHELNRQEVISQQSTLANLDKLADFSKLKHLCASKVQYEVRRTADEYSHELCAFLASLKTGLDFLSRLCSYHLQGVEADSIRTLMRLAEKGRRNRVLVVVAEWMDWLVVLRDYRHHFVHRLVLLPQTGHLLRRTGHATAMATVPVIVPERTPHFVLDTRRARFFEEDEGATHGLVVSSSETRIIDDEGNETVSESTLDYSPAPGYLRIDSFMEKHLTSFDDFLTDLLSVLSAFQREQTQGGSM